jgi:putative drug exporter of the RND superfamily
MLHRLGALIARHWVLVILFWIALTAGVKWVAPQWDKVTHDGDLAYLPARMTSVRGEARMAQAFPQNRAKSQMVLVVDRADGPLTPADLAVADALAARFAPGADPNVPVVEVWSRKTEVIGHKLVSSAGRAKGSSGQRPPGQAALVILHLPNEFMAIDNMVILESVQKTLEEFRGKPSFPPGLRLELSGSAAIGADMLDSARESIENTEMTTVVLVCVILLLVYRAPMLVVVPLVTIVVSVSVAMDLVALLTQVHTRLEWFDFKIFKTTKIFIIVILFGAGTDFCLFLISRYKEELDRGLGKAEAIARALGQVGDALAGSAMTTICGLGMMFFADFGKFRNSGPAIALCLTVALLASLTLTPAMLRGIGGVVFWPFGVGPQLAAAENSRRGWAARLGGVSPLGRFWEWISHKIIAHPGLILVTSVLVLAPLAYEGLSVPITYDFLNEMQARRPSVRGTRVLQRYFSPGETGPVTILVHKANGRFNQREAQRDIARLTKSLYEFQYPEGARGVQSVRSLSEPLGDPPGTPAIPLTPTGKRKFAALRNPKTMALYLTQVPELAGTVTRFDLVLKYDPFSRDAVELLNRLDRDLVARSEDPASPWYQASFDYVGTTPGIRDLKAVTESDQIRIQQLVVLAVFGVLLVILRRPLVCLYLILSVLFSYYVTIGATELFFSWLYGPTFDGLDWKVPLFLFVILIAVGEDYNIYLVTRVFEEQAKHGLVEGLRRAVVRTGGIITSCGVIMAGTFMSMMTGTLRGMHELGFALSLGVMLDTVVVRPILVPAFLAMFQRGRARAPQTDENSAENLAPVHSTSPADPLAVTSESA